MSNSHLTHKATCPVCGYVVDRARNDPATGETDPPQAGDLSVCFRCGAINQYTEGQLLIPQPLFELPEPTRNRVLALQASIRTFHRSNPARKP